LEKSVIRHKKGKAEGRTVEKSGKKNKKKTGFSIAPILLIQRRGDDVGGEKVVGRKSAKKKLWGL